MLRKLIGRIKTESRLDERIVWGILVERRLQITYKILAAELRVPISILARHILGRWLAENFETLITDSEARAKYGEFLTDKYLKKQEM